MANIDALDDLTSRHPNIRLFGPIDDNMLKSFLGQLAEARDHPGPIVLELSTTGGNADTARRMALEIRLARRLWGKDLFFFGKTMVYSAGVTLMAAFPPERRILSADTRLLIHERHMDKSIHFTGALRASLALARDLVAEIEIGQQLEREGFEELVAGSSLSLDDLMARVMSQDWYVSATEALRLGLVGRLA